MLNDGKMFDTNVFFSGGAGMFLQYHDVVKPVYLFAVAKMILMKQNYGLPLEIISDMTSDALLEWYFKRRYKNPLRSLDYGKIIDPKEMDDLMDHILKTDSSIYKMSLPLNIQQMLSIYTKHKMTFPVHIYSEKEESYIYEDCRRAFPGISIKYHHGDLKEAVKKCDHNFTYILSDIELVKELSEILIGTCSHILLAREYRYNYKDHMKTLKYDLKDMQDKHPFVRIGLTFASDIESLSESFENIMTQGGNIDATNQRTETNREVTGHTPVEV